MAVSGSSSACDKPAQPAFRAVCKRAKHYDVTHGTLLPQTRGKDAICMQSELQCSQDREGFFALVVSDNAGP